MAQIERVFTTVSGKPYMVCLVDGVLFYAPCDVNQHFAGWCYEQMVSMPLAGNDVTLHPLSEHILLVQAYIKLYLSMAGTPDD